MRYAKGTRFKVTRTGKNGLAKVSVHLKKTTAMKIANKSVGTNKPVMLETINVLKKKKKTVRKKRRRIA